MKIEDKFEKIGLEQENRGGKVHFVSGPTPAFEAV